jgi:L-serine/L-threonine ammonia-lyase
LTEGNATLVDELYTQLSGDAPTAIICSVGGGGLLNGIMLGLTHHSWATTAVLGVETHGSDSLAQSLRVGANTTIPTISSIARSLGVTRVSDMTWEFAKLDTFKSVVLSDAEAAMACVRFKEAEGVVIETACGVSVAACYAGVLKKCLKGFGPESRVVVICCGGKFCSLLCLGLAEYQGNEN